VVSNVGARASSQGEERAKFYEPGSGVERRDQRRELGIGKMMRRCEIW
jgi:hypothetical protein